MKATILFLLFAASLSAQQRNFSLGMQLGPSVTSYNNVNVASGSPNFSIASYFLVRISKYFSVRGGAGFERKGTFISFGPIESFNAIRESFPQVLRHFDYITIPLLLRWNSPGRFRCFANMGGFNSVQINIDNKFRDISIQNTFPDRGPRLGWCAGLGFEASLRKSMNVSLEFRQNLGGITTFNFLFGIGRTL
jgi:hypothetical protein